MKQPQRFFANVWVGCFRLFVTQNEATNKNHFWPGITRESVATGLYSPTVGGQTSVMHPGQQFISVCHTTGKFSICFTSNAVCWEQLLYLQRLCGGILWSINITFFFITGRAAKLLSYSTLVQASLYQNAPSILYTYLTVYLTGNRKCSYLLCSVAQSRRRWMKDCTLGVWLAH